MQQISTTYSFAPHKLCRAVFLKLGGCGDTFVSISPKLSSVLQEINCSYHTDYKIYLWKEPFVYCLLFSLDFIWSKITLSVSTVGQFRVVFLFLKGASAFKRLRTCSTYWANFYNRRIIFTDVLNSCLLEFVSLLCSKNLIQS
jgi:hypothetical protein